MIPAEAVEAAAKAYRHEFPYDENEGYVVQLILEAAAPLIRAQAFDEAAAKLRSDMEVPQRIWVSRKVTALAMIERGDS